QVVVMQEDVAAAKAITPGGKVHPIDAAIQNNHEVTLGGTTLTAHLTPGHTHGATTWTMKAEEAGKTYNVVFATSYRPGTPVSPESEAEFNRTFPFLRTLPCDIPLGDHPAQYNLNEKYTQLKPGSPNPFVDPANCWVEAEVQEAMLRAQLAMQ